MTDMITDFNADFFHIATSFSSTDPHRPNINGVLVEPHPEKGVLLIATDGARLIVIHDEHGLASQKVHLRLNKSNLALCQKKRSDKIRGTKWDLKRRIIVSQDGTTDIVFGEDIIGTQNGAVLNVPFPDWQKVIPEACHEQPGHTGYNGQLLASFSDAAKRLTGSVAINFATQDNKPAIVNFHNCSHAFGVVTPLKASVSDKAPRGLPAFMQPLTIRKGEAA